MAEIWEQVAKEVGGDLVSGQLQADAKHGHMILGQMIAGEMVFTEAGQAIADRLEAAPRPARGRPRKVADEMPAETGTHIQLELTEDVGLLDSTGANDADTPSEGV